MKWNRMLLNKSYIKKKGYGYFVIKFKGKTFCLSRKIVRFCDENPDYISIAFHDDFYVKIEGKMIRLYDVFLSEIINN